MFSLPRIQIIGRAERAHPVVQPAHVRYMYVSVYVSDRPNRKFPSFLVFNVPRTRTISYHVFAPCTSARESKGRSACLGVVPLSNNVVETDMLLKSSRKEWSACPGVVAFNDNMKGTEEQSATSLLCSHLISLVFLCSPLVCTYSYWCVMTVILY